jgi:hypothetical protein
MAVLLIVLGFPDIWIIVACLGVMSLVAFFGRRIGLSEGWAEVVGAAALMSAVWFVMRKLGY